MRMGIQCKPVIEKKKAIQLEIIDISEERGTETYCVKVFEGHEFFLPQNFNNRKDVEDFARKYSDFFQKKEESANES